MLPFFSNNIPGFSVEEMAAPGKLFGRDDGCWEWKGPVIHEMTTAYGKFFRRKSGFVARELYPDFINYRRSAYPLEIERYGWGVALYTTPEIWFGKEITHCDHIPEESFNILVDHLASRLPRADHSRIVKLLL